MFFYYELSITRKHKWKPKSLSFLFMASSKTKTKRALDENPGNQYCCLWLKSFQMIFERTNRLKRKKFWEAASSRQAENEYSENKRQQYCNFISEQKKSTNNERRRQHNSVMNTSYLQAGKSPSLYKSELDKNFNYPPIVTKPHKKYSTK